MRHKKEQNFVKKKCLVFFNIVICAVIVMAIQYIYVHGAILNYQPLCENLERGNILYQLYCGGLFLENSMDSFSLMCSFGVFLIEVLLLNGKYIGEWFQNLELMLYRTERRSKLLYQLMQQISVRNISLILCNTCLISMIEGIVPTLNWFYGAIMHLLLLEIFALCVILGYLLLNNELVYLIVGMLYYIPIILIGFWYEKENELWKIGRYFFLLRGNWNYFVPVSIVGKEGISLCNMEVFGNVNKWGSMGIIVGIIVLLYLSCERALNYFQTV